MMWLMALLGCADDPSYIVEGTIVKRNGDLEVVIDHKDVPGLMGPMVMPFRARDAATFAKLEPGHQVIGRFEIAQDGGYMTKVRVTGKGPAPEMVDSGPEPLQVGAILPKTLIQTLAGEQVVGVGQKRPTVLTFIYTRCPVPEFCPATIARFQALQAAVDPSVRLLAVTLDPAHDTDAVLTQYAADASANPAIWTFGRAQDLPTLALRSSLPIQADSDEIVHGIRVLVLNRAGEVRRRFDDHAWSIDDVKAALLEP